MGRVVADITMSLDGFVAGPNPTLDEPLGKNGEELHEWALQTAAWREQHGLEGGEVNVDSELMEERVASVGAHVMGRKMFSGGSGPWEEDPRSMGWWGEEPPFHVPVFVLTHHSREPVEMKGGTTFLFVTEGIEAAVEQARVAAGDHDVAIAGGGAARRRAAGARGPDPARRRHPPLRRGRGSGQARGHARSCVAEGDAPEIRRRLLIRLPSRSRT
jgi:dihydrofolate reductase